MQSAQVNEIETPMDRREPRLTNHSVLVMLNGKIMGRIQKFSIETYLGTHLYYANIEQLDPDTQQIRKLCYTVRDIQVGTDLEGALRIDCDIAFDPDLRVTQELPWGFELKDIGATQESWDAFAKERIQMAEQYKRKQQPQTGEVVTGVLDEKEQPKPEKKDKKKSK